MADLRATLHRALSNTDDVFTGHVSNAAAYIASARASISEAECEPFAISAVVMPPAFPDHSEGEVVSGYCLAKREGYWLVYSPAETRFYCFWGIEPNDLGAHGVFGSPLACWLA